MSSGKAQAITTIYKNNVYIQGNIYIYIHTHNEHMEAKMKNTVIQKKGKT